MTTVTVDATPRLSRFDVMMPHGVAGIVSGYTEALLQEPETGDAVGVVYGPMTSRVVEEVVDDTVDVGGVTISFAQLLEAMEAFTKKWREQDQMPPTPVTDADGNPMQYTPPPSPNAPQHIAFNKLIAPK